MGEAEITKIGIFYLHDAYTEEAAKELSNFFTKKGVEVYFKEDIERIESSDRALIISLGGDGTFLRASHIALDKRLPVLGINLGSLGFLTDVEGIDINSVAETLIKGNFSVEERNVLKAIIVGESKEKETVYAINDVVLLRSVTDKILQLELTVNGMNVGRFRADGLVFSTSTGSTAYSLSLGGPIVVPQAPVFSLVFVAPHKLSVRPVIFSLEDRVSARILSSGNFSFQRDGEEIFKLGLYDRFCVEKGEYNLKIVHLKQKNFFEVLNKKFEWGI